MFLRTLHIQLLNGVLFFYDRFETWNFLQIIVPTKEMLLSFSIRTFLTNYDVTIRKQQELLINPIVRKTTF